MTHSRNPIGLLALVALVTVAAAVPATLMAQEEGQQGPSRDTADLVFEREVFRYPAYERRNPFATVADDQAAGPRFDELTLIGIIRSPDPDLSVALFAEGVEYDEEGGLQTEEGRGGVQVGGREGTQGDTAAAGEGEGQAEEEAPEIETLGYETFRVRQGDQLGNMRILEIQRMRVIVEVEEFGLTERREFVLRTPANRGGQP